MVEFVDSFGSDHVHVHFDTGNIMPFQFPEHWIPILGKRIRNIHFKEYTKERHRLLARELPPALGWDHGLPPAVIEALEKVSYQAISRSSNFQSVPAFS
jgi:hexulose-6-phosphate isomerase